MSSRGMAALQPDVTATQPKTPSQMQVCSSLFRYFFAKCEEPCLNIVVCQHKVLQGGKADAWQGSCKRLLREVQDFELLQAAGCTQNLCNVPCT